MPTYKVVSPIKYDGERHEPNAEIDMSAKDAVALLKSGSIVAVPPKKDDGKGDAKKSNGKDNKPTGAEARQGGEGDQPADVNAGADPEANTK